jgi:hypothetical protein
MSTYLIHTMRWLALGLALVIAQIISGMFAHAVFAGMLPDSFSNVRVDWLGFFTGAGLEAAAVYCLLMGLWVERRHQVWILFAFYWGTKFFQMLIEAAFFLNLWQAEPMMSWPELMFSACYGTVTSLLFAPLAVWIVNARPAEPREPVVRPPLVPALKVGAVYVLIYFVAGMVLAVPLAGPAFTATYENLQLPAWLPLFQFARGLLWAGILWLLIGNHGPERDSRVTAAVVLGTISSFQLLQPNPYMADQLRAAHLTEVLVSMTLFGWLAAWILSGGAGRAKRAFLRAEAGG